VTAGNFIGGLMPERIGFDQHRDPESDVSRKHGDTVVAVLRHMYGDAFAPGISGDLKLRDVLGELDEASILLLVNNL
jgi:hypothetical protein